MNRSTPAGETSPETKWDLIYRPKQINKLVAGAIVIVIVIHLTFGLLLSYSYTGVNIGWGDKLALITIGFVISGALLLFTRSRLRVGPEGVGVQNLMSERFYEWEAVRGMGYPEKAQWARLLFDSDEHIPVMAVQARDGADAVAAMRRFRELQAKYRPDDARAV
ncbi:MAG: PH domain-containing protein [Gordonia sp. (in: high G+C Gram-positive bacteria)]|uniref:PH domain-containing protein n=1 Tax=Gordonia sp. (in: high G+C Gram-positive bacteria) TaxID=84139 RepID=UPI003BB58787